MACSSMAERPPVKRVVVGSSPTVPANHAHAVRTLKRRTAWPPLAGQSAERLTKALMRFLRGTLFRGTSSFDRASVLHAEGAGFESPVLHQTRGGGDADVSFSGLAHKYQAGSASSSPHCVGIAMKRHAEVAGPIRLRKTTWWCNPRHRCRQS